MMGKDFWEDVDIDTLHLETQIKQMAVDLITEYGVNLSESDLLRINGAKDSQSDPIKRALLMTCLEFYMTTDYAPKSIETKYVPIKKWWQVWK